LVLALAASVAVYANVSQNADFDSKTSPPWQPPNPLPADPPLPGALAERYYLASESQVLFGQLYSAQLTCLPYAERTPSPLYMECLANRQQYCRSIARCTRVEIEVMSMFLEHYGGLPSNGSAPADACGRDVEEDVIEDSLVRWTPSQSCAAREVRSAAIAARWAARQRDGAR
jgi:hypothetical protein